MILPPKEKKPVKVVLGKNEYIDDEETYEEDGSVYLHTLAKVEMKAAYKFILEQKLLTPETLKFARKSIGMNIKSFAKVLDMPDSNIKDMEDGKLLILGDVKFRILNLLKKEIQKENQKKKENK